MSEEHERIRAVMRQKVSEILNNDVCVIVCFQKPVKLVPVVLVAIFEGLYCFTGQVFTAFRDFQSYCWKRVIGYTTEKYHFVAPFPPSFFHSRRLFVQVFGCSHYPAQHTDFFTKFFSNIFVHVYNSENNKSFNIFNIVFLFISIIIYDLIFSECG